MIVVLVFLFLACSPSSSEFYDEDVMESTDENSMVEDSGVDGHSLRRSPPNSGYIPPPPPPPPKQNHYQQHRNHGNRHHLDDGYRRPHALGAVDPHLATYSFSYSVDGPPVDHHRNSAHAHYGNHVLGATGVPTKFGHQERRDGGETRGSYYVALPDGRLQTVEYVVDGDTGYRAKVSYEGKAIYLAGKNPPNAIGRSRNGRLLQHHQQESHRGHPPQQQQKQRSGRKLGSFDHASVIRKAQQTRRPTRRPLALQFEDRDVLARKPFRRFASGQEEEVANNNVVGSESAFVPTPRPLPPPPAEQPGTALPPVTTLRPPFVFRTPTETITNTRFQYGIPEPLARLEDKGLTPPLRTLENFRNGLLLAKNELARRSGTYYIEENDYLGNGETGFNNKRQDQGQQGFEISPSESGRRYVRKPMVLTDKKKPDYETSRGEQNDEKNRSDSDLRYDNRKRRRERRRGRHLSDALEKKRKLKMKMVKRRRRRRKPVWRKGRQKRLNKARNEDFAHRRRKTRDKDVSIVLPIDWDVDEVEQGEVDGDVSFTEMESKSGYKSTEGYSKVVWWR